MPPLKNNKNLVVIKKKRYVLAGGGHGGSAWKIAYADFVTAMMAFFLLMWLVNSMSHEADKGTYEYFDPLNVSDASSGAGGVLGGETIKSDGTMQDTTGTPGEPGVPAGTEGDMAELDRMQALDADAIVTAEQEKKEFEEVEKKIQEAIESNPDMKELAKNLLMEITPEGLKIQIVDQFKKPMFPKGSSMLYYDAQQLLTTVAASIKDLPQPLMITGHTDTSQYRKGGYSNWDLSTDRANAVRRFLAKTLSPHRFFEIGGKADTDPLLAHDPLAPSNRRISITLKSIAGTAAQQKGKTPPKASSAGGQKPTLQKSNTTSHKQHPRFFQE